MNGAGEDRGQDLFRSPAELHLFGGNVLAFGSRDQIEIVDVNTLLLGEAQRRACRRADGIIRHGFGWAGYFDLDVGLFGAKSLDPGGQAAGRAERLHRYAIKEIFRDEKFPDIGAEFLLGFREHPGGNFFAADLEEEFDEFFVGRWLHARTSRCGAAPPICERYDAAVRQARVRTRVMSAARSVVEITPRASIKLKSCEHLRQWS